MLKVLSFHAKDMVDRLQNIFNRAFKRCRVRPFRHDEPVVVQEFHGHGHEEGGEAHAPLTPVPDFHYRCALEGVHHVHEGTTVGCDYYCGP